MNKFSSLKDTLAPNPQKERQQKYYQEHRDKLNKKYKQAYRDKQDSRRLIADMEAPAKPALPLVPKEQRKLERELKKRKASSDPNPPKRRKKTPKKVIPKKNPNLKPFPKPRKG